MSSYLELLRERGVARLVISQLVARFPAGMFTLALLMHEEQTYASYGAAGIVIAALAIGQAIAGPVSSRLMARLGMRRLLIATTFACAAALAGLAFVRDALPASIALAAAAGLSMPPITPAVRTIYPKLVNASRLGRLFAIDATLQELIWVAGPLVATGVAFLWSTTVAVLLCSVVLILGGAWFWSSREVGEVRIPRAKKQLGDVLRNPIVLSMTLLGLLMVGVYGGIETAVVATFGHDRPEAGLIIGLSALGSLIGGFLFGHLPVTPRSLAIRVVPIVAGAAMCCVWTQTWWLAIAFFISGVGCAPVISGSFAAVSSSVKFSQTAESYGWMGTGQLVGGAVSSSIAGAAIDAWGPFAGYLDGAIFAVAALALLLIARGVIPDLRGRDASPRPDTAPVEIVS